MKIILCYTSENGGFDWLEKEYMMDEINFEEIIQEYVQENKTKAKELSDKWEINGEPDPLYLNFRMSGINKTLFRLIDKYMDTLD
jgi:hypothetical protein